MDRNTTIGLSLIAGIVITWMVFFADSGEANKSDKTTTKTDSTAQVSTPKVPEDAKPSARLDSASLIPAGMSDSAWNAMGDSARQNVMQQEKRSRYGHFAGLVDGQNRNIRVKTDLLDVNIGTRGAYIRSLYLNKYKTHDSLPLPLVRDEAGNRFFLNFSQTGDAELPIVETDLVFFTPLFPDSVITLAGSQSKELAFRAQIDDRTYLDFVYTFKGDAYDYGFELRQKGMDRIVKNQVVTAQWEAFIPKTESAMEKMREKTAIYFRSSGSVDWLNPRSANGEVNDETIAVDWVSFHSQFFAQTLLTAEESQRLDDLKMFQADPIGPDPEDLNSGDRVKFMQMNFSSPIAQQAEASHKFKFFAGPLDFNVLKGYERDMQQQIELGWGPLKWINRFMVIPVFRFLEGAIGSYGIIILILGILIKIVLLPLSYRTQISTTRMRVVNSMPEMKALDEKYKDNPTKLQQEKMVIYRKMGVSLLGGCWPMLLSYPFLIAFFFFFPNAIELRQQSFLWAHDLSTYDSILDLGFNIPFYGDHVSLFTLLMTVSIYAFTFISQQNQAQMNTNPVMKWMPYVMPIIFLGFLNSYSAGLSWYYLISNVLSIAQTLIIKRFINEDALLAKMEAAAKDKKDSGKGKSRIERWAEEQQKRQREMQKSRDQGRKGK